MSSPNGSLIGASTENLDSVCIDCHGNASSYDKTSTYGTDPFGIPTMAACEKRSFHTFSCCSVMTAQAARRRNPKVG